MCCQNGWIPRSFGAFKTRLQTRLSSLARIGARFSVLATSSCLFLCSLSKFLRGWQGWVFAPVDAVAAVAAVVAGGTGSGSSLVGEMHWLSFWTSVLLWLLFLLLSLLCFLVRFLIYQQLHLSLFSASNKFAWRLAVGGGAAAKGVIPPTRPL